MSEPIVCKPTPWFQLRAAAMILMFGIFAVLFYKDGTTGYREKNLSFYLWKAVQTASAEFAERKAAMSPEAWKEHAAAQVVELPDDRSLVPVGTPDSLPWPAVLGDYAAMDAGEGNPKTFFEGHMEELGVRHKPGEHAYDASQIRDQMIIFWVCVVAIVIVLFFLFRTLGRRMVLDEGTFQPAGGRAVKVADLVRLDLRKWATKGLAFAWAREEGGGERRIRIDGLTYGGFRKEQGEPAEKLMQGIRAAFSGELIEYENEDPGDEAEAPAEPAQ